MQALSRLLPRSPRRSRDRQDLEFRVVPVFNGVMRSLLAVERQVLRLGSLPFGSSIIAVAARSAGESPSRRDPGPDAGGGR
jgi:hypothetical protein